VFPLSPRAFATLENSTWSGSDPNRARAWKIADFEGRAIGSSPDVHARPSVNRASTSS